MKTTAKSLVMKPMFRSRIELDKKKEARYNPPNFDDIEDVEWKEWLEWKNNYKKNCELWLQRAGIIVEAGQLAEEYK